MKGEEGGAMSTGGESSSKNQMLTSFKAAVCLNPPPTLNIHTAMSPPLFIKKKSVLYLTK